MDDCLANHRYYIHNYLTPAGFRGMIKKLGTELSAHPNARLIGRRIALPGVEACKDAVLG